jgi:lysophospholipase L1-like esterase
LFVRDQISTESSSWYGEARTTENRLIPAFELNWGVRLHSTKEIEHKKIENNFKEMIKLLDNRNVEIYIVRFFNDEMRFLDIFYRFDRMLNRIQKEYPNVRIIKNIWEGVWGKKEYKYDLSHPNSKGNIIIANNIFNEIKDVLEYNNLIK